MNDENKGCELDQQTSRELRFLAWLLVVSVVVLISLLSLYIFPSVVSEYLSIAEGVIRSFIGSTSPPKKMGVR